MRRFVLVLIIIFSFLVSCSPSPKVDLTIPGNAVARVIYFHAGDCTLCQGIYGEVLQPLLTRCGDSLELKAILVDTSPGFEVFVDTEKALIGESGRWDIPTIVVGETYFIGVDAIRSGLLPHLQCVFADGGNSWPDIPSLSALDSQNPSSLGENPFTGDEQGLEECISDEEVAVCASPNPIFVLYLSTAECESACDRTIYDLRYLQGRYPHMFFEEKSIEENKSLAKAICSCNRCGY